MVGSEQALESFMWFKINNIYLQNKNDGSKEYKVNQFKPRDI